MTVTPRIVEKYKMVNDNVFLVTNYPIIEEDREVPERKKKRGLENKDFSNCNFSLFYYFLGAFSAVKIN